MVLGIGESFWQIVNKFFDTIPTRGKVIIFLLFLSLLGFVIPMFLHGVGYHCDGDSELTKVPFTAFATNFEFLARAEAEKDILETGTEGNTHVQEVPGTCLPSNIVDCTDCIFSGDGLINRTCVTIGNRLTKYSILKYPECFNPFGHCAPPTGWYFNHTHGTWSGIQKIDFTGQFQCIIGATPQCNISARQEAFSKDLDTVGDRVPLPTGSAVNRLENMVGVGCDGFDPQVRLFHKINMFDFRTWALTIILGFIVLAVVNLKAYRR